MASDLDIPFDRITYRDGQLLTALDLSDEQRRHDRLRRLHVRYLHDTWGIALGFEVRKAEDNRAVVVGPGYAVDGTGRDILLAESIHVTVPTILDLTPVVLTMRYQEDAAFRDRPDLAALCLCGGLDPRHERPLFAWRLPDEVRFGPEVPLVQVVVEAGVIQGELDGRVRRYTQPLVRPHIGWGETEPGRTGWRQGDDESTSDWRSSSTPRRRDSRVCHTISRHCRAISAIGVGRPPSCSRMCGPRERNPPFSWEGGISSPMPIGSVSRIGSLASGSCRSSERLHASEAESRQWTVAWVGLEPVSGCEPALDFTRLFTLSGFPIRMLASFVGTSGG